MSTITADLSYADLICIQNLLLAYSLTAHTQGNTSVSKLAGELASKVTNKIMTMEA